MHFNKFNERVHLVWGFCGCCLWVRVCSRVSLQFDLLNFQIV